MEDNKKSCNKSCGPSDYCKGGKCDINGCYSHPSDSDIEDYSREFSHSKEIVDIFPDDAIQVGVITGAKWMRDRMNGEMCLFMEWREENYTKTKKGYYHKGDFYKNDKPLTTEQLLQKFRNRDL